MSQYAEDLIAAYTSRFNAAGDRKVKTVFAGNRRIGVHQDAERVVDIGNGVKVRVWTDASGHTTQIEENEALHGIARPRTLVHRNRNPRGSVHVTS